MRKKGLVAELVVAIAIALFLWYAFQPQSDSCSDAPVPGDCATYPEPRYP